jgi:hypothetical protein
MIEKGPVLRVAGPEDHVPRQYQCARSFAGQRLDQDPLFLVIDALPSEKALLPRGSLGIAQHGQRAAVKGDPVAVADGRSPGQVQRIDTGALAAARGRRRHQR